MTHLAQCTCGAAKMEVRGRPLFRLLCHCTICQAFNNAPYADVSVFRTKDVVVAGGVAYKTYRPPPAIQRGKCASCDWPSVEHAPFPPITIIPSVNFREAGFLPPPAMHIFYEKRIADIQDALPRYNGYWRSQMAFFGCYLRGLRSST